MKAEDVRIGNLVYYHIVDKLNEPEEWDAENIVDCFDIAQMVENPESNEYKPIPLTEELIMRIKCRYHEDNYRMEFRMIPPGERQLENNYWSNEVHDFAKLHLSPSYHYELIGDLRVKSKVPEFWFIWITSSGTGSNWFMPLMDIRGHTLQYFHQLQNLYFDLTGKELTL